MISDFFAAHYRLFAKLYSLTFSQKIYLFEMPLQLLQACWPMQRVHFHVLCHVVAARACFSAQRDPVEADIAEEYHRIR